MAFRRIDERTAYDGGFVHVVVATFEGDDGSTFERELIRHRGAVAVVALTPDGRRAVLVRQYRATIEDDLLELTGPSSCRGTIPTAPGWWTTSRS